ncbi:MAG: hypothetical protein IPP02_14720 [Chitinophagaceae bacterium]|nr:hypothetical protein [Chitinophagaceae bacterium]
MKAKSIKGKPTEEISSLLTESMVDGYQPTLAIVFLSVKQDWEAISKLLDEKRHSAIWSYHGRRIY